MSWMTPGNVFRPFSSSSDWQFRSLFDDFDMDEFFGRGTGTAGSLFGDGGRRPLDRLRRTRGLRENRYTGAGDSAIGGGDYYVRSPPSPTGSSRSYFSSRSTSDTVTTTPAGGGSAAHTVGSAASGTPTSAVTSAAFSTGRSTESPHQKTWTTAIDLVGFKPEEIAVKCEGNKLRIRARREEGEDLNEVRRTLTIPAEVEAEKVSTILTMEGALVVKAPLLQANQQHQRGGSDSTTAVGGAGVDDNMSSCSQQDLSWDDVRSLVRGPGIQPLSCLVSPRSGTGAGNEVENRTDGRMFKAEILVREFHPQEIKVRQKGDQVYIDAESRQEREGQTEMRRMERSFTLPRGVDVENLVSRLTEDGRLLLEAPFVPPAEGSASTARSVPIEGVSATPAAAAVAEQPTAGSGDASSSGDTETKKD